MLEDIKKFIVLSRSVSDTVKPYSDITILIISLFTFGIVNEKKSLSLEDVTDLVLLIVVKAIANEILVVSSISNSS